MAASGAERRQWRVLEEAQSDFRWHDSDPYVTASFAELEEDFLRITAATVFCAATTVDAAGRPRNRMLHPIFVVRDGRPLGWALTGRTPLKSSHLAANPHMACAYWTPTHDTAFVDCVAEWVEDEEEKQRVWDLFYETPEPLGWGPHGMAGYGVERWRNPVSPRCDSSPGGCRSCAARSTRAVA